MLADYDAEGVTDVLGLDDINASPRPMGFEDDGSRGGRSTSVLWLTEKAARYSLDGPADAAGPLAIERAVEQGLPRQVLRHLAERIVGDDKGRVAALE